MNTQSSPYVITRFDRISILNDECPRAAELLGEFGLHCANCLRDGSDTIEAGATIHHMSDEEINDMVKEINTELEKEWRERNPKHEARNPKKIQKSNEKI